MDTYEIDLWRRICLSPNGRSITSSMIQHVKAASKADAIAIAESLFIGWQVYKCYPVESV